MLNFSGKLAPAGLVSVVRASDILWAHLIEIYWFGQRPNTLTLAGVSFVVGSILAIAVEKIRDSRKLHKKLSNVDIDNATSDEEYDVESPRKGR
jgi:drug/metabolite transporter (DMT)-like permease